MIIKLILTVLAILSGFRTLNMITDKFIRTGKIKHRLNFIIPLFELLVWIALVMWFTRLIYQTENYELLISFGVVFALFFVPGFSLLRDFIVGIFLKAQNIIFVGALIELNQTKGEVKKAGHFMLEIVDHNGDIRTFPYNKIRSQTILRTSDNINLIKMQIEFSFPQDIDIDKTVKTIHQFIINSPWSSPSKMPVLNSIASENGMTKIVFGVYSIHESYAGKIKAFVEVQLLNHEKINDV